LQRPTEYLAKNIFKSSPEVATISSISSVQLQLIMNAISKSTVISVLSGMLYVEGFIPLHNTNNNYLMTKFHEKYANAESLVRLNYSNQMDTTLFAEDSEITPPRKRIIKRSPSIRVRKSTPIIKKKKDIKKTNSIIEPLLDHKLLSKEDEYALCTKIKIMTQIRNQISDIVNGQKEESNTNNKNGSYRNSDILVEECSRLYGIEGEMQLALITDEDIKQRLKLKGGRKELNQLLEEGSNARQTLIQCNMKLVNSIAKRWLRNYNKNYGSPKNGAKLFSKDQPEAITLDDLIQEGVLGLSRAIDKFDISHDVRFTTYATHWITSHVRTSVKNARYGCLRVPSGLQALRTSYIGIVRPYSDAGQPIPSKDDIARQLGVSERRLQTALAVTQPLLSIDAPLATKINNKANSNLDNAISGGGGGSLTLMDTLICPESSKAEQRVDISFLRQYLENAMSAELSPHERDVIRLRLGLDDGVTKTVKEVVDVCGGAVSTYGKSIHDLLSRTFLFTFPCFIITLIIDIRSVEKRAFQKLRSPNSLFTSHLLQFLDDEILNPTGCNSSSGGNIASASTIAI